MNKMIDFLNDDRNPSMYGILTGICKGEHWSLNEDSLVLNIAYSYCVGGCGVVGMIPFEKTKQARVFFESVFFHLRKRIYVNLNFHQKTICYVQRYWIFFPIKNYIQRKNIHIGKQISA